MNQHVKKSNFWRMSGQVFLIGCISMLVFSACEERSNEQQTPSSQAADKIPPAVSQPTDDGTEQKNDVSAQTADDAALQETQAVEEAVRGLLDAMQSAKQETIQQYTDYHKLLKIQSGVDDTNLLAVLRRMQYEILETQVEKDHALVKVAISNIDLHAILPEYNKQMAGLQYENALAASPKAEEELLVEYYRVFDGMLNYQATNRIERAVDIQLNKQDGQWRIEQDEHLRSAAFGDFWNASTKVGENAQ